MQGLGSCRIWLQPPQQATHEKLLTSRDEGLPKPNIWSLTPTITQASSSLPWPIHLSFLHRPCAWETRLIQDVVWKGWILKWGSLNPPPSFMRACKTLTNTDGTILLLHGPVSWNSTRWWLLGRKEGEAGLLANWVQLLFPLHWRKQSRPRG